MLWGGPACSLTWPQTPNCNSLLIRNKLIFAGEISDSLLRSTVSNEVSIFTFPKFLQVVSWTSFPKLPYASFHMKAPSSTFSLENHDSAQKYSAPIPFLSLRAKMWKQPKRPSTEEWIQKMWYIHNEILFHDEKEHPAICNNMDGPGAHYAKWDKSEKDKCCMISLTCVVEKKPNL